MLMEGGGGMIVQSTVYSQVAIISRPLWATVMERLRLKNTNQSHVLGELSNQTFRLLLSDQQLHLFKVASNLKGYLWIKWGDKDKSQKENSQTAKENIDCYCSSLILGWSYCQQMTNLFYFLFWISLMIIHFGQRYMSCLPTLTTCLMGSLERAGLGCGGFDTIKITLAIQCKCVDLIHCFTGFTYQ